MEKSYMRFCAPQIIQKSFTNLCGLLAGVDADKEVNSLEFESLKTWFQENITLKDKKPFTEIFTKFSEIMADKNIDREEILDLKWLCERLKTHGSYYNTLTKDVQFMHGLVAGIASDNKINEIEVRSLKNWLADNEHLKGTWPYDEFYSLSLACLKDKHIDEAERKNLMTYFQQFLNLNGKKTLGHSHAENTPVGGICAIDPEIIFEYKRFAITGNSSRASKEKIKALIEECAGQVDDDVTYKTNYLIVLAEGNPAWAYSAYGRKIERAMELRKKEIRVTIIHENDLWDALRYKEVA